MWVFVDFKGVLERELWLLDRDETVLELGYVARVDQTRGDVHHLCGVGDYLDDNAVIIEPYLIELFDRAGVAGAVTVCDYCLEVLLLLYY